jgi:sarcosine oxidase subunit beta
MVQSARTVDIAIVGGGILGLCTAFYLAQLAPLKIFLLEKDLLAQASTGLSVGGIRQQFSHPSNIRLSQMTLELFSRFEETFGQPLEFHRVGYLFLAEQMQTWDFFLESVRTQQELGVPVEALSPHTIQKRWPFLNTDDLQGGTSCAEDGYADPYSVAMAFAEAARTLGVSIQENAKALEVLTENGRVLGIRTTKGNVAAPIVINTAGAWAAELAATAEIRLPVKPYRRQVYVTRRFEGIPRPLPLIIDQDSLFYFRSEGEGILMGMTDPDEPSSFHTHVDRDFLENLIGAAIRRAPILTRAEILRGWGGLYAVTPDENPIIGQLGELDGFFGAVGFSGHGFQHGPAVARLLSELILTGKADFDLRPFSYARFTRPAGPGEKRTV